MTCINLAKGTDADEYMHLQGKVPVFNRMAYKNERLNHLRGWVCSNFMARFIIDLVTD